MDTTQRIGAQSVLVALEGPATIAFEDGGGATIRGQDGLHACAIRPLRTAPITPEMRQGFFRDTLYLIARWRFRPELTNEAVRQLQQMAKEALEAK